MAARRSSKKSQASMLPIAGRWAFIAGMIVAIVYGLIPAESLTPAAQEWVSYILMALGVIAGYLHFPKEAQGNFILLAIGLAIFSNSFFPIPTAGTYITGMLQSLALFFGIVVIGIVIHNVVDWFVEQF